LFRLAHDSSVHYLLHSDLLVKASKNKQLLPAHLWPESKVYNCSTRAVAETYIHLWYIQLLDALLSNHIPYRRTFIQHVEDNMQVYTG